MKRIVLFTFRWFIFYPMTLIVSIPLLIVLIIVGAITDHFRWQFGHKFLKWWSEIFFILGKFDALVTKGSHV